MYTKQYIFLLSLLIIFIKGQELIFFDIQPKIYDIQQHYQVGNVDFSINSTGLCDSSIATTDCYKYLNFIFQVENENNGQLFQRYFSQFDLNATVSSEILNYEFNVYPRDVSGNNITISIIIIVDGIENASISTQQISSSGFNPLITVIPSPDTLHILSFTFPDIVDLTNYLEPVVFNLDLFSNFLVQNVYISVLTPEEDSYSVLLEDINIVYHDSQMTSYRGYYNFYNTPGVFSIQAISITLSNGASKVFDNLDLQSLSLQYEFINKPEEEPENSLPELSDVSINLSTTDIPLSWNKFLEVYASITITEFPGNLESAIITLNTMNQSIVPDILALKRFAFPENNKGIVLKFLVDATILMEYNCVARIYNPFYNFLEIPCGTINVYSPYPEDLTPPTVSLDSQGGNSEYDKILYIQTDDDTGISKIIVDGEIGQTLYPQDRINGTTKSGLYRVLLSGIHSNTSIPITVFDYNHNSVSTTFNITVLNPPATYSYHPSISFNSPPTYDLTSPTTSGIFMNFIDSVCQVESNLIIQSIPLIPENFEYFSNFYDLVNGTACDGTVGRVYVFPENHKVESFDTHIIPISHDNNVLTPLYYSSLMNADTDFLSYQPIMLEGVEFDKYIANTADDIEVSVQFNSGVRLYQVNLVLEGLNQNLIFPLVNTIGTVYDGTWTSTITIPEYANNGTWTINLNTFSYLGSTNFTYDSVFSKGYPCYVFINSYVDILPPQINNIDLQDWVTSNQIILTISDNLSGVQSVNLLLTPNNLTEIYNPDQYFRYSLIVPGAGILDDSYICTIPLPDYFYAGQYWMYIVVSDYSGNTMTVTPDTIGEMGFQNYVDISSPNGGDTAAPLVTEFTFSTNVISSNLTVLTVNIEITDDNSGINSFSVYLNTSTNIYKSNLLTYDDDAQSGSTPKLATFQTTFTFPSSLPSNTVFYGSIANLVDNAGNSITLPKTFIPVSVTVNIGGVIDKDLPEIYNLIATPSLIDLNESPASSISIQFTIVDASPLQSIPTVILQHSTQSFIPIVTCVNTQVSTNTFTFTCDVEDLPTGNYYIHVKSFSDTSGNYNSCYKCNSITIINSADPKIISFTSVPTLGGRATFQVENFINASATIINVEDIPCENLQFDSINQISCDILNGTGIIDVKGFSSNRETNLVFYSYQLPSIASTTSVLPPGGSIVIYGMNFGNSSLPQRIQILVGSTTCTPSFVNDTHIVCNLLPFTGLGIIKNVQVTVDTLKSIDGVNKFSYNDPPDTPCSSPTCSGNGQCVGGSCFCSGQWSGPICDQKTFPVPQNTSTTNPTVIITPNSTNQDISTLMAISVAGFNEIDYQGNVVSRNVFTNWKFTQSSTEQSDNFYYSSIIPGSSSSNITVLLQVFKETTVINFAGQDDTLPPNGMKYSVNITNYPWKAQTNTGQLVIKSELMTQASDQTFCAGYNETDIGQGTSADDIRWIKISQGNFTIYGKFSNRAVIDGRPVFINNVVTGGDLLLGDNVTSSSYVGVNVPHFYKKVQIDPNFSVLLNPNYQSERESQSFCEKTEKSKKWVTIVIATIASVVGVVLLVSAILYFRKWRAQRELERSLSSFSNKSRE